MVFNLVSLDGFLIEAKISFRRWQKNDYRVLTAPLPHIPAALLPSIRSNKDNTHSKAHAALRSIARWKILDKNLILHPLRPHILCRSIERSM